MHSKIINEATVIFGTFMLIYNVNSMQISKSIQCHSNICNDDGIIYADAIDMGIVCAKIWKRVVNQETK